MNIIEKTRNFMRDNGIDYLLVNSTNEFLVEYTPLEENSRYFLTGFSGSTGDAVISQKDIFLFVDGRYHQQADQEVDKKNITVIKMKMGESFNNSVIKKLNSNKVFAMVAQKNSQGRYEILKDALKKKNIEIKLLDTDPIKTEKKKTNSKIEQINVDITGISADEKFKKLSKTLKPHEAILLTNLEEISYLCNLRDFSQNFSSKIKAKCLIKKDFAELFYESDLSVGKYFINRKSEEFETRLSDLKQITTVFVDKISTTAFDYALLADKALNLKENQLKKMKSVKNNPEISHYKECFKKTDKALAETREFINNNKNISEYDITKQLEANFYKYGAKSLSFKSIVAKDQNSALAHYSKSSKDEIMKEGSLILIDCGAYYEGGYATDITRVFVKGNPTKLQKSVYTSVLRGFLKAFNKKITAKTTGFDIDKTARKLLEENKPQGFEFSHSLGHGIGINVHESPPSLSPTPLAKTIIEENMCFTIEPGLYNPKHFGIRLENSCYLTESLTIESFSTMCFEEKLIDYSMLTQSEKKQLKNYQLR